MSSNPNFKNDPELLRRKTKDDQNEDLKNKTEKRYHENILKPLEIDNEYYEKKHKSLNKNKVLIIITEILFGSAPTISSSTMGLINPGAGINTSSSTDLSTSIAILITNENISKLKIHYTKLQDWINVITLFYEKTVKTSIVDGKSDEKEAEELKKIYNHYLDKRKDIMKKNQFKVEDVFSDIKSKDKFGQEQIPKLDTFLAKFL